jgi:hypothetical protein
MIGLAQRNVRIVKVTFPAHSFEKERGPGKVQVATRLVPNIFEVRDST